MSLLRIRELEAQLARRDERIAELEPDAARYRWLRQCADIKVWTKLQTIMPWATDHFDAAIDAAMKESAT